MGRIVTLPQTKTSFNNRALYTSNTTFHADAAVGTNLVKITVIGEGANGSWCFSGAAGGWAQKTTQLTNGSNQCIIISCGTGTNTCFGSFIYATAGQLACTAGCGVGGSFNYCGGFGICSGPACSGYYQCHYCKWTPHHPSQHAHHTCCLGWRGICYGGGGAPGFCGNGNNACAETPGIPAGYGASSYRICHFTTAPQHAVSSHCHCCYYVGICGHCSFCPSINYDVTCTVTASKCSYPCTIPMCNICGVWTGCNQLFGGNWGICVVDTCILTSTLSVSTNPYAFCTCVNAHTLNYCIMGGSCPYQLYYGHPGGFGSPLGCHQFNCWHYHPDHHQGQEYCNYNCSPRSNRNGCFGSGGAGNMCGVLCGYQHNGPHGDHCSCSISGGSNSWNYCGCGGQGAIFVEW